MKLQVSCGPCPPGFSSGILKPSGAQIQVWTAAGLLSLRRPHVTAFGQVPTASPGCSVAYLFAVLASWLVIYYHSAQIVYVFSQGSLNCLDHGSIVYLKHTDLCHSYIYTYTYISTYIYIYMYVYVSIYIYIHTYICQYVCIYTYVYVHTIYIYAHVYIYIYI